MKPSESKSPSDVSATPTNRDAPLEALNRLSAVISQSERLEEALVATLDQLLSVTGADIGSIHVLEPDTSHLKLVASRGVSQRFVYAEEQIPVGECLCGQAACTGELIASPDLSTDPRLSRPACRDERFGSLVSIPLKSRDRVLGILTIYAKRPNAFSEMDRELAGMVGRQIGVAVENAQLYARARQQAVVEERGHIAREIHDGIAQNLAYLGLEAQRLKDLLKIATRDEAIAALDDLGRVIQETYEDVRELLVDFRTRFKEGESLREALGRYIEDFDRRTGIKTHLTDSSKPPAPSFATQVQIFRIIQEALSNVRKHASARNVTVTLSSTPGHLEVTIRDDGRGFDPEAFSGRKLAHLGLEIMKERAAKLGGMVALQSRPGNGTTLRVRIPIEPGKGQDHGDH